ncbi:conserved hypothetical protein, membrane [Candidatus Desulfofervidus auxilii]|uniref:Uncharacterized protein n=1 Tax=Desulfofervidus auxilii TaxID=1621989 RepID=A0A7U4QMC1_DESA2|nr:hypothetical protein [Candidatus Desulfofervidus auxilii]AMM42002.1 conserved hypothetical protein, membrane [Candidatus Desulfofervidus auxilii]CAD7780519.1 hypothetical protein BLFGPEAP_02570 [Candidatus Methanoperedenaceae archaeon GB50]CAD7781798.1 hypothetical protein DMNBHIDG_02751 [Candidatus Methanoperedenaceae archaeon GB37]
MVSFLNNMKENTIIKNPLTVISIFAGLAEVAGTAVLPFVSEANQNTYIWFLIIFPILLVVLFFITLNFNPKVLYAPSDFRDENNYMDLFRPSSTVERKEKLDEEIKETTIEEESKKVPKDIRELSLSREKGLSNYYDQNYIFKVLTENPRSRYILAESLVIERLSQELQLPARREVALKNSRFIFDAVFEDKRGPVLVEVKYISNKRAYHHVIKQTLMRLKDAIVNMPDSMRQNAKLILAIAHELHPDEAKLMESKMKEMLSDFPIPVEIKLYQLAELITNKQ